MFPVRSGTLDTLSQSTAKYIVGHGGDQETQHSSDHKLGFCHELLPPPVPSYIPVFMAHTHLSVAPHAPQWELA